MLTPEQLIESIERWLEERGVPFLVHRGARGFVHADVQVSVDARTDEGCSCLQVQAIVLTGFEPNDAAALDRLQDQLRMFWSTGSQVMLELQRENCTIWACFGWVADAFDPTVLVDVLDEVTGCALELGPGLHTHVGSGVLGTLARFMDPPEPVESEYKVRRREARHRSFERGVEHLLGYPSGSIRVTLKEPAARRC